MAGGHDGYHKEAHLPLGYSVHAPMNLVELFQPAPQTTNLTKGGGNLLLTSDQSPLGLRLMEVWSTPLSSKEVHTSPPPVHQKIAGIYLGTLAEVEACPR